MGQFALIQIIPNLKNELYNPHRSSNFLGSPPVSNEQSPTSESPTKSSKSRKLEQTEPVDFSSSPLSFTTPPSFSAKAGSANDFSSRFRPSPYSSFGLAPSYNSLLTNGYSAGSYYGQSGYDCLSSYAAASSPFSNAADGFSSLSSALAGTTSKYNGHSSYFSSTSAHSKLPSQRHNKDGKELIQCPTPGCDGVGHISGNYATHRRCELWRLI